MPTEALDCFDVEDVGRQLHDDHEGDDECAAPADFGEHGAVSDACVDAFAVGEGREQHHDAVGDGRNEDQSDLPLPTHGITDAEHDDSGHHQSTGPAGVEDVQPGRLVLAVDAGDQRVDDGFDRTRAQCADDAAPVEHAVAIGEDGHEREGHMTGEREDHRLAVADAVDDEAEQDDAHAERPQARTEERPHFRFTESERGLPLGHDQHSKHEGEGRGHEGDETCAEEHRSLGSAECGHGVGILG